jgi:hypothetical protein
MNVQDFYNILKNDFDDWQWEFYINNNCEGELRPVDDIDSKQNRIKFLSWIIEQFQEIIEELTK